MVKCSGLEQQPVVGQSLWFFAKSDNAAVAEVFNVFLGFFFHFVKKRVEPVDGSHNEQQHTVPEVTAFVMGEFMVKDQLKLFHGIIF